LQREVDYLTAENRVLREKLSGRELRLTVAERRRLAVLDKELGRKTLAKVATIARPETILRWYRELVAKKYDGSKQRGPGRPRKRGENLCRTVPARREWHLNCAAKFRPLTYTMLGLRVCSVSNLRPASRTALRNPP
jgi:hypothetical protein